MTPSRPWWSRIAVVAATMVPLCLIGFSLAQPPGFPGGGGGIPRPPGMPGPGGARPGGGFPPGGGIPGPGMPGGGIPRPGIPGGGIPGGGFDPGPGFDRRPGGGIGEDQWEFKCSACGAVVGTGRFGIDKPNLANCPHCGVRFDNTGAGMRENANDRVQEARDRRQNRAGPNAIPNRGGGPAGGVGPISPDPNDPAAFNNNAAGGTLPVVTSPAATTRARASIIVLVIIVVGGLLLLLAVAGIGGLIWMVTTAPSAGGSKREPRRAARRNDGYKPI